MENLTVQPNPKHKVQIPSGPRVTSLGQGTWKIGDQPSKRQQEIGALQMGIELGMNLIDTAEMYGNGASESLVGEAIAGRRDQVYLVSKVLPQNSGRSRMQRSCEESLKRLNTDHLDLYLLHWRGEVPLQETVAEFEKLRRDGKILRWGVSNFDVPDLQELMGVPDGKNLATNQILYNLNKRGPERGIIRWANEGLIPTMAYSPVDRGDLDSTKLTKIAKRHGVTPEQVALAWVLRNPGVIAIPKASQSEHVQANRKAWDLRLDADDLHELDQAFPEPKSASLEMY